MIRVFFLMLSLLFATAPLPSLENSSTKEEFFQEEEESSPQEKRTPFDSKTLLIKTVLLLAGLVGMLYGGAHLIKRMGGSRFSSSNPESAIKLVERQFLSPKTSVWLIEVKNLPVIVVDGQNGVGVYPLTIAPIKEKDM